jgi:hypothetical protein
MARTAGARPRNGRLWETIRRPSTRDRTVDGTAPGSARFDGGGSAIIARDVPGNAPMAPERSGCRPATTWMVQKGLLQN